LRGTAHETAIRTYTAYREGYSHYLRDPDRRERDCEANVRVEPMATDVVLITADAGLRDLIESRRPPTARLHWLTGEDPTALSALQPRQLWVDLDTAAVPHLPEVQRRVYFYSQPGAGWDALPKGQFIRKPCAALVCDVLWADVQSSPSQGISSAVGRPLPAWILDFQELNLALLCRKMVTGLAARLGYRDVSLYLHDFERGQLVLAEATHTRDLERTIPLDAVGQHLMAAVARSGRPFVTQHASAELAARGIPSTSDRPYPDEACLVAPLFSEGRLWGVLNFSGLAPTPLTEPNPPLDELFEFLGRALCHARLYQQARIEARVDSLTGLYNQRWMQESLQREVRRAERFGGGLSILMLDLDGLKAINDQFGHLVGDRVLRHVASRIRGVLRQFDGAARIGGDEFLIMLPATNLKGAQHVARRLLDLIRAEVPRHGDTPLPISASIGVAEWQPGWDSTQLIEAADRAMYEAKGSTRNGRIRPVASPTP